MTEPCHEYFGCKQTACKMYGQSVTECWRVEGTLCCSEGISCVRKSLPSKQEACKLCQYFKMAHQGLGPTD